MANVLGDLFQNIANAIRTKTGDTDTMKPIDMPSAIENIPVSDLTVLEDVPITLDMSQGDQTISVPDGYAVKSAVLQKPDTLLADNIREGIDIAGIIGTMTGGTLQTKIKLEEGYLTGNSANEYTVEHNLGTVPDAVFLIYEAYSIVDEDRNGIVLWSYGFSEKLVNNAEKVDKYELDCRNTNFIGNYSMGMADTKDITNDNNYQAIRNATDKSITFGSKFRPLGLYQYHWYAFSFFE